MQTRTMLKDLAAGAVIVAILLLIDLLYSWAEVLQQWLHM